MWFWFLLEDSIIWKYPKHIGTKVNKFTYLSNLLYPISLGILNLEEYILSKHSDKYAHNKFSFYCPSYNQLYNQPVWEYLHLLVLKIDFINILWKTKYLFTFSCNNFNHLCEKFTTLRNSSSSFPFFKYSIFICILKWNKLWNIHLPKKENFLERSRYIE